ncbi:MAG: hypothetical protein C0594_02270, partial [Marinilabiliales bacterium]
QIPEKYNRYKISNNKIEIKKRNIRGCPELYKNCIITQDGNVVLCCMDKKGKYSIGNVNNSTVNALWHSSQFNEYRTNLNNNELLDICHNCPVGR